MVYQLLKRLLTCWLQIYKYYIIWILVKIRAVQMLVSSTFVQLFIWIIYENRGMSWVSKYNTFGELSQNKIYKYVVLGIGFLCLFIREQLEQKKRSSQTRKFPSHTPYTISPTASYGISLFNLRFKTPHQISHHIAYTFTNQFCNRHESHSRLSLC